MNQKDRDRLDMIHEDIKAIHRGVYGDKTNNVKGLIQRQEEDEQRWKLVEPHIEQIQVLPSPEEIKKLPKVVAAFKMATNKKMWTAIWTGSGGAGTALYLKWEQFVQAITNVFK